MSNLGRWKSQIIPGSHRHFSRRYSYSVWETVTVSAVALPAGGIGSSTNRSSRSNDRTRFHATDSDVQHWRCISLRRHCTSPPYEWAYEYRTWATLLPLLIMRKHAGPLNDEQHAAKQDNQQLEDVGCCRSYHADCTAWLAGLALSESEQATAANV